MIGAGPSVKNNNHLELLSKSHYKGTIVCTDRMLIPCLKNGITPYSATCPVILAILIGHPYCDESPDPIKILPI